MTSTGDSSKMRWTKSTKKVSNPKEVDISRLVNEGVNRSAESLSEQDHFFYPLAVAFFLLLQAVVSSGSYSGEGRPPMFGDYEAQRHWMELTINLPPTEWYFNTSRNDLNYWGLDYPPLTAFHSWACGQIARSIDPKWVELGTSRGHESPKHKLFMRLTVVVSMLLLYAPAIVDLHRLQRRKEDIANLFFSLCYPGLLYVDNGHFQYNHIALAFALRSFLFFFRERYLLGSVFFVLAFNFKQIALYYALPVFVFLFFRSFVRRSWIGGFVHVFKLGAVVAATMLVVWLPFLSLEQLLQVLHRIFPMARGLYEDHVASFWCAISPAFKFREFPVQSMAKLSSLLILLLSLPTLWFLGRRPTDRNFRHSLFLCSAAFFLLSVHVHEKTILFVALPAFMLLHEMPTVMSAFLFVSMFSMYPLCVRDQLPQLYPMFVVYYGALIAKLPVQRSGWAAWLHAVNLAATSFFVLLLFFWTPPARFPYIIPLLFAEYSFVVFASCFLFVYYTNIAANWTAGGQTAKKRV